MFYTLFFEKKQVYSVRFNEEKYNLVISREYVIAVKVEKEIIPYRLIAYQG